MTDRGHRYAAVLLGLLLCGSVARGEEAEEPPGSSLIPFPFYFYSPETKSGGGIALTYYRRAEGASAEDKPSTYNAMFIFTQRKQLAVGLSGDWYSEDESLQFQGGIEYAKFPDTFYGVGNATDEDISEEYTPRTVVAAASFRREIAEDIRVGPFLSYVYQEMLEIEDDGQLATGTIAGSDGGTLLQAGLTTSLDRRDAIVYPRSGHFSEFTISLSDGMLGSDFDFASFGLHARAYLPLGESQVVAARALLTTMTGTPAFQVLASLGGDSVMRGYYAGRFRDRQLYVFEGEYRSGYFKRLGFAVFASMGDVAERFSQFRLDEMKFSAGFGFRVLVDKDESVTVRADMGYADDGTSGFYLGILEAF